MKETKSSYGLTEISLLLLRSEVRRQHGRHSWYKCFVMLAASPSGLPPLPALLLRFFVLFTITWNVFCIGARKEKTSVTLKRIEVDSMYRPYTHF